MLARTLIVDDEPLARVRMRSLLEKYSSELEIIDEAGSGAQAIAKINELTPDVVFLDIQMPDMDAFDVLKDIDEDIMPLIVFTTAFENFALRAYEENTVDYLLKPVDPERLEATMEKLRKRIPDVLDILKKGTVEARERGAQTLQEVRHAMRIDYFEDPDFLKEQIASRS